MITLKPSSANYLKGTAFSAIFVVPIIAVQLVLNRERAVLWLTLVIVVPICIAAVALYFARARIVITDTRIGQQGIFGTRWTDKTAIDRALLVRGFTALMDRPRTDLFIFAADGRKLLRLFGRLWAEEDMIALATATGATQGLLEGPISTAGVRLVEPTALNWVEAHPWLSAFAITFGIVAVVVAVLLAVVALS